MTATSAGSTSCLTAKGLDISLAALQRQDPYINNIVDVASQVALYTYNNRANEWEKTEVEGTLFIYTRLASPRHGFTIMNRLSMENLTEPITKDLDFQLQHPFLLYRNARLVIHGIWFYDKEDCQRIAQRMKILTQQEQALAQSQGGWLSPGGRGGVGGREGGGGGGEDVGGALAGIVGGGGGSQAKAVDIIQMLTKARTEYDKSASEPKEIGGISVLYGNPNLIKPIPVKPSKQDSDTQPKPLSLATLFGSQPQHSPKPDPAPPTAAPETGPSAERVARPPVARSLKYDDAVNSGRGSASASAAVVCSDGGPRASIGRQTVGQHGGNAVAALLPSPTGARQQQQNPPQHCPAIQKLMQGQGAVAAVGGGLQTLSESPENRLCDNGVPLELHHHLYHHHHHHQQHHLHHHHQQQQQQQQQQLQQLQLQADPIMRLFQTQPTPASSNLPALQQSPHRPSQPLLVDSVSCSHLQAQQSQQLFFSLVKAQTEAQHNQGPGLLPSPVTADRVLQSLQGPSSQMPGVVSPHELLQKLHLVQQEQSLTPHDPPRPCPGLAPRFLGPTQIQGAGPVSVQTAASAGQKAALQFQVISPQRIPATVAPNLLLSPSVFTQGKSGGGFSAVAQESCPGPSAQSKPPLQEEIRVLSRSQIQATLLHMIQTDSSFLDTIYEAYVSRFANDSRSKY